MGTRTKAGVGGLVGVVMAVVLVTARLILHDLELGRRPSLDGALALLGVDLAVLGLFAVGVASARAGGVASARAGGAASARAVALGARPASGSDVRGEDAPPLPALGFDPGATQVTLTVPATPDALRRSS